METNNHAQDLRACTYKGILNIEDATKHIFEELRIKFDNELKASSGSKVLRYQHGQTCANQ